MLTRNYVYLFCLAGLVPLQLLSFEEGESIEDAIEEVASDTTQELLDHSDQNNESVYIEEEPEEEIVYETTSQESPHETGPGCIKSQNIYPSIAHLNEWSTKDEGTEVSSKNLSELHLTTHDLKMFIGGKLKDEAYLYSYINTLRTDYHDRIDFFRHKFNLDLMINQGTKKFGRPSSEAGVRIMNYVFWQDESNYLPITVDRINLLPVDNLQIAQNLKAKALIPLIFVEQAWFKLHFDTFTDTFKNNPTFLQVGYFPYMVGRGVTMGFHDDLAVDYLGWAGEGGYTRYPFMPPGALFRMQITDQLTWDAYFNLWRETNASLIDVLSPERSSRLSGPPERGSGKDRQTWVTKFNYSAQDECLGNLVIEPYFVYVNAPELMVELPADASSKLYTIGVMTDWRKNNLSFNIEVAGQFGHQNIHAIDRNVEQLTSGSNGQINRSFSHVNLIIQANPEVNPVRRAESPVSQDTQIPVGSTSEFVPDLQYHYLVNNEQNRNIDSQGDKILRANGTPTSPSLGNNVINNTIFANNRFRPGYRLSNKGFMALADISYEFECQPLKIAGSIGHISGDNFPYNDEVDHTYRGFIPMRSRYVGLGVQNFFIFDRLVLPRPLNISYRTLYAFNNLKDLSNLQFFGVGLTWFPFEDRKRMTVTTDMMFLWEHARLFKWDVNGKHPDPAIEAQLVRLRNTPTNANGNQFTGSPTLFSGWESAEHARRFLGVEIDMKFSYKMLDHCDWNTKVVLFFPGGLYKDLIGQPNQNTQRIDERKFLRYDSLGKSPAFGFVTGFNYRF